MGKMDILSGEKAERGSGERSLGFARSDVLLLMWRRAQWLDSLIGKKELKISEALKQRVYMSQVECSLCKAILYGLKDEELEVKIRELEKTLENCVVIPKREQSSKSKRARF